jgi:hypothetical protein
MGGEKNRGPSQGMMEWAGTPRARRVPKEVGKVQKEQAKKWMAKGGREGKKLTWRKTSDKIKEKMDSRASD